jgi:hypothetical protein
MNTVQRLYVDRTTLRLSVSAIALPRPTGLQHHQKGDRRSEPCRRPAGRGGLLYVVGALPADNAAAGLSTPAISFRGA